MNLELRKLVIVSFLALLAAACGSDDGATVRDLDPSAESGSGASSGSSSAPGSGSSSGSVPVSESGSSSDSGSATGISTEGVQTQTDNELVAEAVESYEMYVSEQVVELIEVTTTFTDAVRAADLDACCRRGPPLPRTRRRPLPHRPGGPRTGSPPENGTA